ncbi:amino acid adenylation domain-containing protein, partial [Actinocrinis puniceicyclus]
MNDRRPLAAPDADEEELISRLLAEEGIADAPGAPASINAVPITAVSCADTSTAAVSFGQERLWFLDRWQPGTALYNVPLAVRLTGTVDGERLRRSVQCVVDRHAALRTALTTVDAGPRPVESAPGTPVPWTVTEPVDTFDSALEVARAGVAESFDLAIAPLVRGGLVRYAAGEALLWLSIHHVAFDGWSSEIFFEELTAAYRAGGTLDLPPLPVRYADYAAWQRETHSPQALREDLDWWRTELSGLPPLLQLPADRGRPAVQSHVGSTLHTELDPDTAAAVRAFARARSATVFDVLAAGFCALVGRWSGRTDVAVATPTAGRGAIETEGLIGFFVNTLVLRADLSQDPTFTELLGRVRGSSAQAQSHAQVPFEAIVDALVPERELSWNPLVQVQFALHRQARADWALDEGATARLTALDTGTAKFDVTLLVLDAGADGMRVELEYATDLFDTATMRRFLTQWTTLLSRLLADPDRPLSRVSSLDEQERAQLAAWSTAEREYEVTSTLDALVARQAAAHPDEVAVTDGDNSLTYRELLERADAVAAGLRAAGVGRRSMVGLACRRCADLVVGMLGILRAGGTYVPLDPDYPPERLSFMVRDSGLRVIVTQPGVRLPDDIANRPDQPIETVVIGAARHGRTPEPLGEEDPAVTAGRVDDIAYLIYTSGSTGTPKAVMVSHRNAVRLFASTDHWFGFGPGDAFSLFHSASFDVSVFEIWGALTTGARLVVVRYWESREPEAFYDLVARERVTVLSQTPGAFRQFAAVDEERREDLALRLVLFAGEALDPASVQRWWERHPEDRPEMINLYGITETTVHVTYCKLTRELLAARRSPVGRQFPDLSAHVLDASGQPAPIGVTGELYVGGAGVAHGYWNHPELTAQRFVPDPYSRRPGARLYRSGDLACRRPDGTLEYQGRLDHQVKIRGFRIEPAEIEAALMDHPGLEACLVLAHGGAEADKRLVAYLVPKQGADPLSVEGVHEFLAPRLPSHMIPSVVLFLDAFPLTANGKVDRRRLPDPDEDRPKLTRAYLAPRTPTEQALAEVWAQVLGLARVGVEDNFFHLGGDSIRSVQVLGLARKRGIEFPLQRLFQLGTVAALAAEVTSAAVVQRDREPFALVRAEDRGRMPADVVDAYPMASLQAGMVFHMESDHDQRLYQNLDSYHIRAPFDERCFRRAVQQVVDRHEILRTSFHLSEYSEMLQLVHATASLPIEVADVRGLNEQEQERAVAETVERERTRALDLSSPPLWRFFIHWRSAESFQWTLVEHHALLDGWSLHGTIAEILRQYMRLLKDPDSPPPAKPASTYRDFVVTEQAALRSAEDRDYWTGKLRDVTRLRLPRWPKGAPVEPLDEQPEPGLLEWALPPGYSDFYGWLETKIPDELCRDLGRVAADLGVPLKSVLLAAHARVVSFLAGTPDVVTGMAFNGRLEEVDGTESRGLFLNSLPVAIRVEGGATWAQLIRAAFAEESASLPHRRFPMAEIQRLVGGGSLYETHFVYNHFHVLRDVFDTEDVRILDPKINSFTTMRVEPTNYPFVCGFLRDPKADGLLMGLDFHLSQFSHEQIRRIRGYYLAALRSVAADPHRPAAHAALTSPGERAQIARWNETTRPSPVNCTIDDLVAWHASARPDAVAVVDGEVKLSYERLLGRADALAARLRDAGVGRGSIVGLACHRSADLVVGMLGILRAGGAYAPLDPDYPADRLAFMVADTGVRVVVGHRDLISTLPLDGVAAVAVEDVPRYGAPPGPDQRTGEDAATLIYTSGSTGRPKGAVLPHRGVIRLLRGTDYTELSPESVVGQISNASFDPLLFEVWGPLLNGGRVVVVPTAVALSPARLVRLLREEEVTAVAIVTALFNSTVQEIPDAFATLKQVYIGGERINLGNIGRALPHGGVRLHNIYGPTEVTSISTCNPLDQVPQSNGEIGRLIANTWAYVVDGEGALVPVGVPGELWLGGPG